MSRIDLDAGVVWTDVGPIGLTPIEVDLLRCLQAAAGRTVSRQELLHGVWGYADGVRSRTVDTTVQRLRAKIEVDPSQPQRLRTVRGVGYCWVSDAPAPAPATELPSPSFPRLDRLVGRDAEIRDLTSLLHSGHRLITLVGPSGVGKTWTARRLLTLVAQRGQRAVWFAEAARAASRGDLFDVVARALDLPPPLTAPEQQIDAWLRAAGPTVGVVDDAQDLDDEALQQLSRWVRGVPDLALVITSQRVLGLEGERLQPIGLLGLDDAVAVLRDRVAALSLPVPPADRLQALAERMGRLPLALELAAPMLDVLPIDDLLSDPAMLTWSVDRPDAPDRHHSLAHAIEASVACLDERDRAALLRLSVFAGPFPVAAAAAVQASASVLRLRRRSFLARLPDGRVTLYDGVRTWARQALRAEGGWPDAARRHARWLASRARDGAEDLLQEDLVQALSEDPGEDLQDLAQALLRLAGNRGPISRLGDLIRALLRDERPPKEQVTLLCVLTGALTVVGQPDPGPALEALSLADRHQDEPGATLACVNIANAYLFLGEPSLTEQYARRAVERAERLDEPRLLLRALNALGNALNRAFDPEAIPVLERTVELASGMRTLDQAIAWVNLANAHALHDKERARDGYQRALQAVGDSEPRFTALTSISLGSVLADLGDLAGAERAYDVAQRILGRLGDAAMLTTLEVYRSDLDLWRGRPRRVVRRLRAVLDSEVLEPGMRQNVCRTLAVLTDDPGLLPDDDLPITRAARAVIAGEALPEGLHPEDAASLALFVRAKSGRPSRPG